MFFDKESKNTSKNLYFLAILEDIKGFDSGSEIGMNGKRKGGLLQNPPLKPKPKLLLLMKTNFYYYFDIQIVCQLFKSFVGNCYLLNAQLAK